MLLDRNLLHPSRLLISRLSCSYSIFKKDHKFISIQWPGRYFTSDLKILCKNRSKGTYPHEKSHFQWIRILTQTLSPISKLNPCRNVPVFLGISDLLPCKRDSKLSLNLSLVQHFLTTLEWHFWKQRKSLLEWENQKLTIFAFLANIKL